ncbi:group II intron maturase-specific domain-containing protein [Streptomyces sp. NPDC051917]|uniref:group II intron maturase-specific domain-containing protein n=1 Tax=Streptomyces sp. NPDC051917 TaxID=3154754 RepID=UPI003454195D
MAGWLNYCSRFRPWELRTFAMRINTYLVRWIRQKHKRLAGRRKALAKLVRSPSDTRACSRTGA